MASKDVAQLFGGGQKPPHQLRGVQGGWSWESTRSPHLHSSPPPPPLALERERADALYAARGVVKRSMIEVGFTVEKLAGPPGKREMFRASKAIESV